MVRTQTAPGIEINEIDRSQYPAAMTGTKCFVMGFTDKGEEYTPMEFTSRTAWTNYYGAPSTEAERYSYAAACEVIDQKGTLYFSRLPYDNIATGKAVGFQYKLTTTLDKLGLTGDFSEIYTQDNTVKNAQVILPKDFPELVDLSTLNMYRTDDKKVPNNTFLIVDKTFNTYSKITEDHRKADKREMIGIMPVVTTAANAMLAQNLITCEKQNVKKYETIGKIRTLATEIQNTHEVLSSDVCTPTNTDGYFNVVSVLNIRIDDNVNIPTASDILSVNQLITSRIRSNDGILSTWDGSWQLSIYQDVQNPNVSLSDAMFSYQRKFTMETIVEDAELCAKYSSQFGWHNTEYGDDVPFTVSQEANDLFSVIEYSDGKFDRSNLRKIGVVVYRMFLDSSEGNKINFEPVESFVGSLYRDDRDPNTNVTTFIDTIINGNSKYINFFSNCFNTPTEKKKFLNDIDIFVVKPNSVNSVPLYNAEIKIVEDFRTILNDLKARFDVDFGTINIQNIRENIERLQQLVSSGEVVLDEETNKAIQEMRTELLEIVRKLNDSRAIEKIIVTPSLGFYSAMTDKKISLNNSIYNGMNLALDKVKNIQDYEIDIVPDAGLACIASYIAAIFGNTSGEYDLGLTDDAGNSLLGLWKTTSQNAAVKAWKAVEQKLDKFCKNTRKDCMFIADGPRTLCLAGQQKIVRDSKPDSSIDADILPYIKLFTGLNTSYGAGYLSWFQQADDYTGDLFWCPPSIKAMGIYINTDLNANYWDAPAGLNRGIVNAVDVAFSPTVAQAGSMYEKNWNYAIDYPNDGIALEGQKTFQVKESAFDRVNVRRLFLRLERMTFSAAKYFQYEGNTAYTRQRFLDTIDPYFKSAKSNGGIYDYKLICDESNNDETVIDNNELHAQVGIKPTKTIEWIIINFVALRTGGSWEEVGM